MRISRSEKGFAYFEYFSGCIRKSFIVLCGSGRRLCRVLPGPSWRGPACICLRDLNQSLIIFLRELQRIYSLVKMKCNLLLGRVRAQYIDFSRLFEIVNLSYRRACKMLGIWSSVMATSSEVGFSVPPEIIEKWMKARMFWLAFSTILYGYVTQVFYLQHHWPWVAW